MPATSGEILNPTSLVLPSYTTDERRALAAEPGTLVYDETLSKICFSKSATVATASWELVTSVQDA